MFSPTVPLPQKRTRLDSRRFLYTQLPSPLSSMRFDSSSMTLVRMMRHDAIGTERRGIYGLSKEADLLWWKGHGIFWLLLVVLLLLLLGWPSRPSWQKKQWHIKCSIICKKQKKNRENIYFSRKKKSAKKSTSLLSIAN